MSEIESEHENWDQAPEEFDNLEAVETSVEPDPTPPLFETVVKQGKIVQRRVT